MRTEYITGEYRSLHPHWHAERARWKSSQVLRGIRETGLRPSSICDIGAGTGSILAIVAEEIASVTRAVAVEPSPDAPFDSRARGTVTLRRQAVENISEQFDVALLLDVMEHVENPFELLRECARIADWVVLHVPLDAHVLGILHHGLMRPRRVLGHLHYFTPQTAKATVSESGLEVVHWFFTRAALEGEGKKRSRINLVRRVLCWVSPRLTQRLLGGISMVIVAKSR